MVRLFWALLVVMVFGGAAVGQAVSYQGRLTDGGVAAEGLIDVRARLLDAEVGGGVVGSAWQGFDVAVDDGLFSVEIDFGDGVFTGSGERWLQIEVRRAGVGGFEVLGPRQRVLSVPRAGFAEEAGVAAFALDGPFEPIGLVPRSSSGLAVGSDLQVELRGMVAGSSIAPVASVLLSPIGEGYGEVVWGGFEIARAWTPSGNFRQLLRLDENQVPPTRELLVRVRCSAANLFGGISGEVVWEVPVSFDSGSQGYRLEVGPRGGLYEVLPLQFDDSFDRADEFRRTGVIGSSGNAAAGVPVVTRPDTSALLGGVSAFGATFGFGNDVPELSVVGMREDGDNVSSVVQSIAANGSLFSTFYGPSCQQSMMTGEPCLDQPKLIAFDRSTPIVVEESPSSMVNALGWALVIAEDGLPYEVFYFRFEFLGQP